MCGRVVASSAREYFGSAFDVTETVGEELPPSYNVAPQAFVYAVVDTATARRLGVMQWGLVPSWANQRQDESARGWRERHERESHRVVEWRQG